MYSCLQKQKYNCKMCTKYILVIRIDLDTIRIDEGAASLRLHKNTNAIDKSSNKIRNLKEDMKRKHNYKKLENTKDVYGALLGCS